jgi:hypothetical protein
MYDGKAWSCICHERTIGQGTEPLDRQAIASIRGGGDILGQQSDWFADTAPFYAGSLAQANLPPEFMAAVIGEANCQSVLTELAHQL